MREANKKSPASALLFQSWLGAILALVLVGGCASEAGPHPELPRLGLLSQFTSRNLCSLGASPEIRVYEAPSGVATYRIQITSLNGLITPSWTTDVPASGTLIPDAAL